MLLLQQMLVLFIIMIIGYWCFKKGYMDEKAAKVLSFIVVNISNPAMILSGSINSSGSIKGTELLMTVLIAVVMYIVLIVLGFIIPKIIRVSVNEAGVYQVMTIFSNIGFMGFPVIQALYGSDALLYASIFLFPYNILIYTYGIHTLTKNSRTEGQEKSNISAKIKSVFNIGVIFSILSIVLYLLQIQMPVFVKTTVSSLSSLTAPLSMMVIGISMAQIDLKELFTDVRLLIFSVIKLLLIPIIGMLIIKSFINNEVLCGVCLIMLATPVGSMTAMLAQQYDGDSELASRGVALTTILSVVTIPIVSAILI